MTGSAGYLEVSSYLTTHFRIRKEGRFPFVLDGRAKSASPARASRDGDRSEAESRPQPFMPVNFSRFLFSP